MNSEPGRPVPELVFQETSLDESLLLTVWYDADRYPAGSTPAVGNLNIYDINSGQLLHAEEVSLSHPDLRRPGPSDEEMEYWSSLVDKFLVQDYGPA
ncbi:MAG TPA: hypothetical protein VFP35_03885 [Candidatus Saccharimonadales bacterium]|nr:hypothetical protein [Candidatus Saccharimonadales bacterium]